MDYRCPICGEEIKRHKSVQPIVMRMEIDCPKCKGRVRLNVHHAEETIVVLNFGVFVILIALAYWFQSQALALVAIAGAGVGALALPVLERTYLRTWRRYVPKAKNANR
jgi:DNA-directed RNA polymerase subunit RPC12/RpoP